MVATRTNEPPKSRGRDRRDHAPEISGEQRRRRRGVTLTALDCRTSTPYTLWWNLCVLMCKPVCHDLCASSVCSHI
jgi:hypothetical protein